jgi:hypothetical protein
LGGPTGHSGADPVTALTDLGTTPAGPHSTPAPGPPGGEPGPAPGGRPSADPAPTHAPADPPPPPAPAHPVADAPAGADRIRQALAAAAAPTTGARGAPAAARPDEAAPPAKGAGSGDGGSGGGRPPIFGAADPGPTGGRDEPARRPALDPAQLRTADGATRLLAENGQRLAVARAAAAAEQGVQAARGAVRDALAFAAGLHDLIRSRARGAAEDVAELAAAVDAWRAEVALRPGRSAARQRELLQHAIWSREFAERKLAEVEEIHALVRAAQAEVRSGAGDAVPAEVVRQAAEMFGGLPELELARVVEAVATHRRLVADGWGRLAEIGPAGVRAARTDAATEPLRAVRELPGQIRAVGKELRSAERQLDRAGAAAEPAARAEVDRLRAEHDRLTDRLARAEDGVPAAYLAAREDQAATARVRDQDPIGRPERIRHLAAERARLWLAESLPRALGLAGGPAQWARAELLGVRRAELTRRLAEMRAAEALLDLRSAGRADPTGAVPELAARLRQAQDRVAALPADLELFAREAARAASPAATAADRTHRLEGLQRNLVELDRRLRELAAVEARVEPRGSAAWTANRRLAARLRAGTAELGRFLESWTDPADPRPPATSWADLPASRVRPARQHPAAARPTPADSRYTSADPLDWAGTQVRPVRETTSHYRLVKRLGMRPEESVSFRRDRFVVRPDGPHQPEYRVTNDHGYALARQHSWLQRLRLTGATGYIHGNAFPPRHVFSVPVLRWGAVEVDLLAIPRLNTPMDLSSVYRSPARYAYDGRSRTTVRARAGHGAGDPLPKRWTHETPARDIRRITEPSARRLSQYAEYDLAAGGVVILSVKVGGQEVGSLYAVASGYVAAMATTNGRLPGSPSVPGEVPRPVETATEAALELLWTSGVAVGPSHVPEPGDVLADWQARPWLLAKTLARGISSHSFGTFGDARDLAFARLPWLSGPIREATRRALAEFDQAAREQAAQAARDEEAMRHYREAARAAGADTAPPAG